MKFHITNRYGIRTDSSIVKTIRKYADVACENGFHEMGIYQYPVETDKPSELSTRLDGIIAAVESGDIILQQLPTGNGIEFEQKLLAKILAYSNCKVILLVHDAMGYQDNEIQKNNWSTFLNICRAAKRIILSNSKDYQNVKAAGISKDKLILEKMSEKLHESLIKAHLFNYIEPLIRQENNQLFMDTFFSVSREQIDPAMIQVCMGLHDKTGSYSSFVGTVIQTVSEHTDAEVCFHILMDNSVSEDNREKLVDIATKYGNHLVLHKMDPTVFDVQNSWLDLYSIASLYRLIIPDIFPMLSKVIYLDADLLFLRDINELWNINIEGNSFAGVQDIGLKKGIRLPPPVISGEISADQYINSGVLVMDLDKIRSKGNLLGLALKYLKNTPDSHMPDQDAINSIFANDIYYLDSVWNTPVIYEREKPRPVEEKVYHFVGQRTIVFLDPLEIEKYYMSERAKTSWGCEITTNDLYYGLYSAYLHVEELQDLIRQIEGKKRIYYGYNSTSMKYIESILPPRSGDYYIGSDPIDTNGMRRGIPVKDFEALKDEKKGEFIVLFLPEMENGMICEKLSGLGLQRRVDFFNIAFLATVKQGGYI